MPPIHGDWYRIRMLSFGMLQCMTFSSISDVGLLEIIFNPFLGWRTIITDGLRLLQFSFHPFYCISWWGVPFFVVKMSCHFRNELRHSNELFSIMSDGSRVNEAPKSIISRCHSCRWQPWHYYPDHWQSYKSRTNMETSPGEFMWEMLKVSWCL